MGLSLVTAPVVEPITRTEAKLHLRGPDSADDDLVSALIVAAREHVENITRRRLVQQTWDYTLAEFPIGDILLPNQPVSSVTSVNYVTTAGTTASFSSGASPDVPSYDVVTDGPRTRVFPKYNVSWPITRLHGNAVTVRFVTGYDPNNASPLDYAANVPSDIKQAMYLIIGDLYENREGKVVGTIQSTNPTVTAMLSPYILRGF